jgi:2,3-bisphosphoglycerate-dependent phosphoglycerate mutase
MRIFIFARHGESTSNVAQVVNGNPRTPVPLTELGERQARQLGDQLRNVELDIAFCTRFPRTRQTAELALAGRGVPLHVEPSFDDINVGDLDGATIGDYRTWKRWHRESQPFPGGESLDDAARRYADALMSLLDRPEQRFLVVCHEVGIRSMVDVLDGAGWRRVPNAVPYLFDENAVRTAAYRLAMYGELREAS